MTCACEKGRRCLDCIERDGLIHAAPVRVYDPGPLLSTGWLARVDREEAGHILSRLDSSDKTGLEERP